MKMITMEQKIVVYRKGLCFITCYITFSQIHVMLFFSSTFEFQTCRLSYILHSPSYSKPDLL